MSSDPLRQSIDLQPAADRVRDVAGRLHDDQLDLPTPCPDYTVRDLVAHLTGLSAAFTASAAKDFGPLTDSDPGSQRPVLPEDWRTALPQRLDGLVTAWADPAAYEGMTRAGALELPAQVAAVVALDELTLHGWDLARAMGLSYDLDEDTGPIVLGFVQEVAEDPGGSGLFGPPVAVPADASLLDRVLGLAGRDPSWVAPT